MCHFRYINWCPLNFYVTYGAIVTAKRYLLSLSGLSGVIWRRELGLSRGEWSVPGESGVIWGRVECSREEWSHLGESGVIWGRVECSRGEWSDLGESGVMWRRVECSRGEWSDPGEGSGFSRKVGRNGPPYTHLHLHVWNIQQSSAAAVLFQRT